MLASLMSAGASPVLALIRIRRGEPRPSEEQFRQAVRQDRQRLHLSTTNEPIELEVAGPFSIVADGTELDEYVVWER